MKFSRLVLKCFFLKIWKITSILVLVSFWYMARKALFDEFKNISYEKNSHWICSNRDKNTFFMTNENKKTSDQLIFVHIFRKKHFKTNLENFMSESLNATSTPFNDLSNHCFKKLGFFNPWRLRTIFKNTCRLNTRNCRLLLNDSLFRNKFSETAAFSILVLAALSKFLFL